MRDLAVIEREIAGLRARWRAVRDERLALKSALLAGGLDAGAVRRDRRCRTLAKEQKRYAKLLRHAGADLDRRRARRARETAGGA